jgi:hypothetical protein
VHKNYWIWECHESYCDLNTQLQSKDQLVHTLFDHIKAFVAKLKLREAQLTKKDWHNSQKKT